MKSITDIPDPNAPKKPGMVVHPLLMAAYPAISLYAANADFLFLHEIVRPLVVIVIAAGLTWLGLAVVLRDKRKSALLVSLGIFLFFSYGRIVDPHTGLAVGGTHIGDQRFILGLLLLVWLVPSVFIVRSRTDFSVATTAANIFAAGLVAVPVLTAVYHVDLSSQVSRSQNASPQRSKMLPAQAEGHGKLPNIFYIIPDTYTRQDILQKVFGYDNSEFIDALRRRGFFVARNSFTNYIQTTLSLSSALNINYLDELATKMGPNSRNKKPLIELIQHSFVREFLRERGYRWACTFPNSCWTNTPDADIFLRPRHILLTYFESVLMDLTPLPVLENLGRPTKSAAAKEAQHEAHRRVIHAAFQNLPLLAKAKSPVFALAHVLIPHPPFIFGANGEPINADKAPSQSVHYWIRDRTGYMEGYVRQVKYTNKLLLETVDKILANSDRPPVIIIQGDTGPTLIPGYSAPDRTCICAQQAILAAYYLPPPVRPLEAGDTKPVNVFDNITPINAFRVILNRYFGTDYKLLEPRFFRSSYRYPYGFYNVTEAVSNCDGPLQELSKWTGNSRQSVDVERTGISR